MAYVLGESFSFAALFCYISLAPFVLQEYFEIPVRYYGLVYRQQPYTYSFTQINISTIV